MEDRTEAIVNDEEKIEANVSSSQNIDVVISTDRISAIKKELEGLDVSLRENKIIGVEVPKDTIIKKLRQQVQQGGGGIQEETDPTVPEWVKNITQQDINNWNNPSISEETDPTVPSYVKSIKQSDIENWTNKADLSQIPTKVSDLLNDENFIQNTVNNLVNYYTKDQVFTKQEVSSAISSAISDIVRVDFIPLQQLPQTGEKGKIYLIPKTNETNDVFNEYIWVNNGFELLGSTQISLQGYATEDFVRNYHDATKQDLITNQNKLDANLIDNHENQEVQLSNITELTIQPNTDYVIDESTLSNNTTVNFTVGELTKDMSLDIKTGNSLIKLKFNNNCEIQCYKYCQNTIFINKDGNIDHYHCICYHPNYDTFVNRKFVNDDLGHIIFEKYITYKIASPTQKMIELNYDGFVFSKIEHIKYTIFKVINENNAIKVKLSNSNEDEIELTYDEQTNSLKLTQIGEDDEPIVKSFVEDTAFSQIRLD